MQSSITEQAAEAARWLEVRLGTRARPRLALIAGSGLGALAERVAGPLRVATAEVPHWPQSTVEGHAGQLVFGELAGVPALVLQGRVHFYEGYPVQQVAFPVRVMQALGVAQLIVTNAAGSLAPAWGVGTLMLIADHVALPILAGANPLVGPNDPTWGPRFPNMANAYSPRLRALAREVAAEQGITLQEGTYMMVSGPSFETPAELRALAQLGGHAVGMSTAPEVVVARHAGIEVLGFSLLTNAALFDPAPDDETTHDEVLAAGSAAAPRLLRLVEGIAARLA